MINSRDICKTKNKANAAFTAQSGKVSEFRPVLEAKFGGKERKRGGGKR